MLNVNDRRQAPRCVKDVGMHCAAVNGSGQQLVIVRNFNQYGFYFESGWNLRTGDLLVLRSLDAGNGEAGLHFSIREDDPGVCATYRSHTLVRVQRSVRLRRPSAPLPRFGIAAAVQIFTD